jgi:Flp pilus assembly protein TadG
MIRDRFSLLGRRPNGQGIAEFALVASFFFLLLFGIIEMGIAVFRYNTVCDAAREAARYAIVHNPGSLNPATTDQIVAVAVDHAPFLSKTDVTVTFPSDPTDTTQEDVLVSISHSYTPNIPFMSAVQLHLTSKSQMLLSQ